MQYSDKTKEKCPDLTYSWCVDLGWGRLAVLGLPVVLETSAQNEIALEGGAVLTPRASGVLEVVSAFRLKAQLLQASFFDVTRETTVLPLLLRLLRSTRSCGHFFLLLMTYVIIVT